MTNLEQQALIYKALGDHMRLEILRVFYQHGDTFTVRMLTDYLCKNVRKVEQASVSHHLRLLSIIGLIECNKDGHHHYYFISPEKTCLIEQALFGGTHFD